ncbi:hypothetical protein PLEI_3636 [Photobacterium leiognathi lrivu.4.1]|uniref:Uncharacterized protein n=1 Tax=Photobacterium leiognathi lrivu.4.1 TaxID=1248232 RepID=V5F3M0_PHOLE|nr:hypothetical protein PLEI_3636 [Photobacterium leiognathi lrivu.4.1]
MFEFDGCHITALCDGLCLSENVYLKTSQYKHSCLYTQVT